MNVDQPIHLQNRDRSAFAYRVVGAVCGLAFIGAGFATSSWGSGWMVALFVLITVGGAVSYHLLTSVVRCPACASTVVNLRISGHDADRKIFSCSHCGTSAYLKEGFYWQREIAG